MHCPHCGKTVSDRAANCPGCGHPLGGDRAWNPVIAALLSLVVPGLGQLYKRQVLNALVWFLVVGAAYAFLIIPGAVLHLFCIIGAALGGRSA